MVWDNAARVTPSAGACPDWFCLVAWRLCVSLLSTQSYLLAEGVDMVDTVDMVDGPAFATVP